MNIVLIGYRGTGKSTVAKILAERLNRKVVSSDARIVETAGTSIPEIVEKHGWDHFRDVESDVIEQLAAQDGIIIDAGGGVIIRDKNTRALRKNGKVFWLTARLETIVKRISTDNQRPSLTGKKSFVEEIEEVLTTREPMYRNASDHVVETDDKTPLQIAEEILSIIDN